MSRTVSENDLGRSKGPGTSGAPGDNLTYFELWSRGENDLGVIPASESNGFHLYEKMVDQYALNKDTGKLSVRGGDGEYKPITAEEFAVKWADMVGPKPTATKRWSFGEWMGVIFSFGLWKPKPVKTYSPSELRERETLKWGSIETLRNNGFIGEAEFAEQKEKYKTVASLKSGDFQRYVKEGKTSSDKKKTQKPLNTKYPFEKVIWDIRAACENSFPSGDDRKTRDFMRSFCKFTVLGELEAMQGQRRPLDDAAAKKSFQVAGYLSQLGKDKETFYKLGKKMELLKDACAANKDNENLQLDGGEFRGVYNLLYAASLLPRDKFTGEPFEILADKVIDDFSLYATLVGAANTGMNKQENAKEVIRAAGLKEYVKPELRHNTTLQIASGDTPAF